MNTEAQFEAQFEAYMAHKVSADPAHDIVHVKRVVAMARLLAQQEQAEQEVVIPAAWLHDCITFPKNAGNNHEASRLAADEAISFLKTLNYPDRYYDAIHHAILVHSYSAGIAAETLEARIVQDADRLDALGAVGISRCMLVGGALHLSLYNPLDAFCEHREPTDSEFVLDHFFKKLLGLADGLHTATARQEASRRVDFMRQYLKELRRELSLSNGHDE